MLLLVAVLGVVGAGLAWRLSGAVLTMHVLLATAAVLLPAARSWFRAAGRSQPGDIETPHIDLQRRRLAEVDAYVRERLEAGDSVTQIASSASWFDSKGGSDGRAG